MPIPFLAAIYLDGLPAWMPEPWKLAKIVGSVGALAATKRYFSGAANASDRLMHGRVVMITGGTSGIGAFVAYELARRGASIVLLTKNPPSDPFVVDQVNELRQRAGHQLIYAEQVDLSSVHSIRSFATRWIDSLPPRRLDMIILCAAVNPVAVQGTPGKSGTARGTTTPEGIERSWMINYLGNFHLLGLLSPALRSQPFDRDVRVIMATCSSYIGAQPLVEPGQLPVMDKTGNKKTDKKTDKADKTDKTDKTGPLTLADWTPKQAYARSKLALMVFARSFQKHVDSYKRPDGLPNNVRVLLVDPGMSRTPGLRSWLAGSSLLWLVFAYVFLYPLWWMFVKSADMGAQSFLFAALEGDLRRMHDMGDAGGLDGLSGTGSDGSQAGKPLAASLTHDPIANKMIKECQLVDVARRDVSDEAVAKALWEDSDRMVEETEKRAAAMRQAAQKEQKKAEEEAKEAEQKSEIEALVGAIKKGKAQEKAKEAEGKKPKKARKKA